MNRNASNFGSSARAVAAIAVLMITPTLAKDAAQKSSSIVKQAASVKTQHRLILQVNSNDPAMMNLALNNAANVVQHYKDAGETIAIEVVTFGPGLHMLRDDTSPVKARLEALALSTPEIAFKACGNTKENMRTAEGKEIALVSQAQIVGSGVTRIMELQEQGWSYVKP